MKGLILAGGKGTRLRPLTLNTPKPIVPIANRPLLLYQISLMKTAGVREIILSLSYQPRKIEDLLKDGADFDVLVRYAVESSPLGTAGAFKNAEQWLDGPAVVFNGDILTAINLQEAVEMHHAKESAATIVLKPVEDPTAYGLVEFDSEGRISKFSEKPAIEAVVGTNTINAGIYILEPDVLGYIPAGKPFSFERELFPALLEAGRPMYAYVSNEYWIDIGTPANYLEIHRDILNGKFGSPDIPTTAIAPGSGRQGGWSIDSLSLIAEGVTLREGARVETSVIGGNCTIDAGAHVTDSVVWSGNTIDQDARVTGSVLGRGCYVGRSAVLKPGTLLGGKSVVTDFSEL